MTGHGQGEHRQHQQVPRVLQGKWSARQRREGSGVHGIKFGIWCRMLQAERHANVRKTWLLSRVAKAYSANLQSNMV